MSDEIITQKARSLVKLLIEDYKEMLPSNERVLLPNDAPSLIYNLMKGNYQYSIKTYHEVYRLLNNPEQLVSI